MTPPAEEKREFIHRLEALRGVAAMMVALGHCAATFPVAGWQGLLNKGVITLCNGRAAVTIFFVLSGFVLGLSMRRARGPFLAASGQFVLRRLFRIYPALAVTSTAILFYMMWRAPEVDSGLVTTWFQSIYQVQPGWTEWWRNLVLADFSINQVTWSLKVELVGSAMIPVMFGLSRTALWRRKGLVLAVLLGVAWVLQVRRGSPFFMFMFYLGYLLPEAGPRVFQWLSRKRAAGGAVILGTALCLLARSFYARPFASFLLEGLGASVLIGGILYGPELGCYRFLDTRVARFYGRISYSFYLIHFSVMYGTAAALLKWVPASFFPSLGMAWGLVLALVSVAMATPLSWACYEWVERPAIALGKRVCASRWNSQATTPLTTRPFREHADAPTRQTPP